LPSELALFSEVFKENPSSTLLFSLQKIPVEDVRGCCAALFSSGPWGSTFWLQGSLPVFGAFPSLFNLIFAGCRDKKKH